MNTDALFAEYILPYIPADHPALNVDKSLDSIKRAGLPLPFVSVYQIIIDLLDCVLSSKQKIQKRWNRLAAVLSFMGAPIEPLGKAIDITSILQKEVTLDIPTEKIRAYLERPQQQRVLRAERSPLPNIAADDSVKKAVEANLTAAFNSTLGPYKVAVGIIKAVWTAISAAPELAPLVAARDILLILKGGIAQRLMLLAVFPEHSETIERYFNLGGDNDCGILINPELPNYDEIRKMVINTCASQMLIRIQHVREDPVLQAARRAVKTLKIGEVECGVIPSIRQHFIIKDLVMTTMRTEMPFYVTKNDLLFEDELGRSCDFALLRVKTAYKLDYGGHQTDAAAEFLDIAVSGRRDGKLSAEHFQKYKDWSFITMLNY
jgi:hypothetical protein